jgi:hypothetical protein
MNLLNDGTAMERLHYDTYYRYLAGEARVAGYPVDFGTSARLAANGAALVTYGLASDQHHHATQGDATFRDGEPSLCRSMFTGTAAVPLKGPWLEIESCAARDIVGRPLGAGRTTNRSGTVTLARIVSRDSNELCSRAIDEARENGTGVCERANDEARDEKIGEEVRLSKRKRMTAR